MEIKIKDLQPNPYRDIENYPINEDKVISLMDSISQTGFWDNILARKINGNIQIAYGHHRLEALKRVLKPEDVIDIPIKDLSDAIMIKIMANENKMEWETETTVIDETVRVTKKFLDEHPEEMPEKPKRENPLMSESGKGYVKSPLAWQIANFLGWKEMTVYTSMKRLDILDAVDSKISKEAYKKLHKPTHADRFIKAVDKWDLEPEKQESVVDEIMRDENLSYEQIEKKVSEAKYKNKPKEKRKEDYEKELKTIQFNTYAGTVFNKSVDLQKHLDDLIEHKEQFGYLSFQDVKDARIRLGMLKSLKNLAGRINKLLKIIEDENNVD